VEAFVVYTHPKKLPKRKKEKKESNTIEGRGSTARNLFINGFSVACGFMQ
jgi:hypothetical protein